MTDYDYNSIEIALVYQSKYYLIVNGEANDFNAGIVNGTAEQRVEAPEAGKMSDFTIHWIDHGREPQCKPDPAYPDGKDLDCAGNFATASCKADLPYPAPRCGLFYVECKVCGTNAMITTAGRPDDPRSVTLPCERGTIQ